MLEMAKQYLMLLGPTRGLALLFAAVERMRLVIAAPLLLAACAGTPPPNGAGDALLPRAKAIAEMESGYQLYVSLRTVGVYESAAMNRDARARVRNVSCAPASGGAATCSYQADRCLDDEQPGADGWCRRTSRFVRTTQVPPGPTSARGWTLDRPLD